MKILVVIPAYNEEGNIENTVKDLKENAPDCDFVVINDCSKDNTKKVLLQNGINFVDLPINLGIGGGVQTGYRYALENDYDIDLTQPYIKLDKNGVLGDLNSSLKI